MKPTISILIPSVRKEEVDRSVKEFSETNAKVDYELVIVSPFEVQGPKVKWVKERILLGSVLATDVAYQNSGGKYIVYFNDHVSPTQDCLSIMLNHMNLTFQPYIGAFKMVFPSGDEIGPFVAYNRLYACYGCMNRDTVKMLGGVPFDPAYKFSWADVDISTKCWEAGGMVEVVEGAVVNPRQMDDKVYREHRKTFDTDFNTFANKWHAKLGAGVPLEIGAISHRL